MSQRHFIRRSAMELSTRSGLQGDGAIPQTSVDATEDVVVQAEMDAPPFSSSGNGGKNNDQDFGGREQDPLLHNSSTTKIRGFTLLDVARETVHLTRARGTYFLGLLALFTLGLILLHGFSDYLIYTNRPDHVLHNFKEIQESCNKNILGPWLEAAQQNLTRDEEFYTLFKQNCSGVYQDPATASGTFKFKNGTVTMSTAVFVLSKELMKTPLLYGGLVGGLFLGIWYAWVGVAVTWGLLVATRTTMSYQTRPSHRAPMHMPPQKLTEVFRELFNPKVILGTIRAALTLLLILIQDVLVEYSHPTLKSLIQNRSPSLPYLEGLPALPNRLWYLANPLPFLYLLSDSAAALEPGMWGFRALWRGIRLLRANVLKIYAIFLMLFLWDWLESYLASLIYVEPQKAALQSFGQAMARSLGLALLAAVFFLPRLFLVPVLYFLCKSWREKVAMMA